jgi:VRR-NUC domain-containing protein
MQRPEQAIQQGIVNFVKLQYPQTIIFHIPNAAKRSRLAGAINKTLGVKAGVADLCILWKSGKCGFMEVKSGTGKLTSHQQSFARRCDDLGVPWVCVKSIDEAQAALKLWGVR